jgi:SsrA-binding protein
VQEPAVDGAHWPERILFGAARDLPKGLSAASRDSVSGGRIEAQKFIAQNRAATFHYVVSERYEAGIVLRGSEVKSLRDGRADLTEAYATVERGEVWLRQMNVASFFAARAFPHAEKGVRKLLLHAKEIRHLERAVLREGYTLLPLDLYFKDGRVKVTLGLCRGRKAYDKRAAIAARTETREALALVRARQRASG